MRRIRFAELGVPNHHPHIQVTRLGNARETFKHTHDFYEVFLVIEGSGRHHLNGREDDLVVGHLIAIRPEDAHWFSTAADTELAFVNVAVSAAWWRSFQLIFGHAGWSESSRTARLNTRDAVQLGRDLQTGFSPTDLLRFVTVWGRVNDALTDATARPSTAPPAWLDTLKQDLARMPESLGEPISFWQNRAGCSPEHLSRSCRRHYGMTLRELINTSRVERAKLLLRTTDAKVITIAFESGFENMANFHRTFLRISGVTPKQWRRMGTATVPQP